MNNSLNNLNLSFSEVHLLRKILKESKNTETKNIEAKLEKLFNLQLGLTNLS